MTWKFCFLRKGLSPASVLIEIQLVLLLGKWLFLSLEALRDLWLKANVHFGSFLVVPLPLVVWLPCEYFSLSPAWEWDWVWSKIIFIIKILHCLHSVAPRDITSLWLILSTLVKQVLLAACSILVCPFHFGNSGFYAMIGGRQEEKEKNV